MEEACDDLGEIIDPGTTTWDALCFENTAPNWSYITRSLDSSDQAPAARQITLQLRGKARTNLGAFQRTAGRVWSSRGLISIRRYETMGDLI